MVILNPVPTDPDALNNKHLTEYQWDAEASRVFEVDSTGNNISTLNPKAVQIVDGTSGFSVDIISTNGYKGIAAVAPGHVSTANSTIELLDPNTTFTGDWEEITNFGVIVLSITSNVSSAEDGLVIEFSSDGTVGGIISDDEFSYIGGSKKTFSFQAAAQYFRVIYTNGSTIQTSFNLQTVLKPYYIKPSSHNISKQITEDDDAELVKSVISGESSLTGSFDNVTVYRGALDVNSAWVHRKIVNETFHQRNGSTNPSSPISEGDISFTLDSVVGLSVGDELKILEGVNQEIGLLKITNIAGNVVTIDRPIANDYTIAADVYYVESNMAVNGTLVSPEIFHISAPSGTVWQITRILISITTQTTMDDAKFGGILALENGVCLIAITASGRTVTFANWKANKDLKLDMYDVEYSDKAPSGYYGLNGRWTFTKSEVVAEINGDATDPPQKLYVYIQDDLTDLDTFEIRAQGRVFSP